MPFSNSLMRLGREPSTTSATKELIRVACAAEGMTLCHSIAPRWYNDRIVAEGLVESGALPLLPPQSTEAYLIGNTQSVWPYFLEWLVEQCHYCMEARKRAPLSQKLQNNRDIISEPRISQAITDVLAKSDPFDTFCMQKIRRIFRSSYQPTVDSSLEYQIYWANGGKERLSPQVLDQMQGCNPSNEIGVEVGFNQRGTSAMEDDRAIFVSMPRVASAIGKYWWDEKGTKLCLHPIYGPWVAFRALVVVLRKDQQQTEAREGMRSNPDKIIAPDMLVCPVPELSLKEAHDMAKVAMQCSRDDGTATAQNERKANLDKGLSNGLCSGEDSPHLSIATKSWIRCRQLLETKASRDHRYCNEQLLYHYTKDTDILRQELNRLLM